MADTNGLKLIGLAFAIVTLAVTATAAEVKIGKNEERFRSCRRWAPPH